MQLGQGHNITIFRRYMNSCVASRGQGGRVPPSLTAKKRERETIGEKREKIGKKDLKKKNREEKTKIGKVLSLCPS